MKKGLFYILSPWFPALLAVGILILSNSNYEHLAWTAQAAFANATATTPAPKIHPRVRDPEQVIENSPASPGAGWEIVIDPRRLGFVPAAAAPWLIASLDPGAGAKQSGDSTTAISSHPASRVDVTDAPPLSSVSSPVPAAIESAPADPAAALRYRIREGDLVDVFVWGQDNLSGKFRVARDGTITVRLAGTLDLRGLTTSEAGARIAAALRDYLVLPAVTVSVAESSGKDVLLIGEVEVPGVYPLDRPMSILELLIRAKYKTASADLSSVTVIRDKKPIRLNLSAVIRGDATDQNLDLQSGDVVVVPGREIVISIHGAAQKPGRYRFDRERTITIRDLLLEGSMWTARAQLAGAFVLRADGAIEKVDINALWFRGDVTHDRVLRNGDAVVLPEVPDVGVYVLGKVSKPGLHQITGAANVMQALALAVPDNFGARLYDARLVRGWPANPRVYPLNLQALLEGDLTQNIALQHGDVIFIPETAVSYGLDFWNRLLAPIGGTASVINSVDNGNNR